MDVFSTGGRVTLWVLDEDGLVGLLEGRPASRDDVYPRHRSGQRDALVLVKAAEKDDDVGAKMRVSGYYQSGFRRRR